MLGEHGCDEGASRLDWGRCNANNGLCMSELLHAPRYQEKCRRSSQGIIEAVRKHCARPRENGVQSLVLLSHAVQVDELDAKSL